MDLGLDQAWDSVLAMESTFTNLTTDSFEWIDSSVLDSLVGYNLGYKASRITRESMPIAEKPWWSWIPLLRRRERLHAGEVSMRAGSRPSRTGHQEPHPLWRWLTRQVRRNGGGRHLAGGRQRDSLNAFRRIIDENRELLRLSSKSQFRLDDRCLERYLEASDWPLKREAMQRTMSLVEHTALWRVEKGWALERYLEASDWPLKREAMQRTMSLVEHTALWRVEKRVGTIRRVDIIEAATSEVMYVNGRDRDGRPIVVYSPADVSGVSPSLESSMSYLVYNLERAISSAEAQGHSQYTFIIDLSSTGRTPPLAEVRASFEVMGQHYPMRSGNILLVHGGAMISMLWNMMKPAISERTRKKVVIVAEQNEAATLTSFIEPEQLERRFKGGKLDYSFDVEAYLADLS
eukprot:CAMPEP_0185791134 /NCGR_PEP_ID=MMETSP1174-20130828/158201_1 /TAXON_ID=35687 /ORGANISM="Dictyocha speculum, Strain CCMP1381" /LENGTH=404 /DNA_ID=CAMNT_0028486039 /DNA_START=233 /DNA_END=1448 /DNA_ORIENTATION=-